MIPVETWFPVVTLLAGTALGGILEALRDGRARQREDGARRHAIDEANRLRRMEFQRVSLLSLQDECTKLIRHIGQMHHHDLISFRQGKGAWAQTPGPDSWGEASLATM